MRIEEINKVLDITGRVSNIYMPNEIFSDLQSYVVEGGIYIAYAYSYTYLAHFLYRNCKYFSTEELIDGKVIKEILGYSGSNRTMNQITKKGGLLEKIGYLESTKDYPLTWEFKNNSDSGEGLTFFMSSELEKDMLPPIPKMFFLKRPVKAFERVIHHIQSHGGIEEEEIQGTFYDVFNTHSVDFDIFTYCMANKELGTMGFYLYSWLKHKNDIFSKGYDVPLDKLSAETGIARRTLVSCMDLMKGLRMISFKLNQEKFVVGMFQEDRKANTYITNELAFFLDKPQPFEKMEVMPKAMYLEIKKKEKEDKEKSNPRIVIDESELPF